VPEDFEGYFREALSGNHARETNQARSFVHYPVQWGYYREHVQRWFDHFPREQFLFLRFEDFVTDTEGQMEKVYAFLGLTPVRVEQGLIFNQSPPYSVAEGGVTARLAEIYREQNAGLESLIGAEFTW
jgi:hypothetical protein